MSTLRSSHKDVKFAFGLQDELGTEATSFLALPTPEDVDLDLNQNLEFYQMGGGGYRGETHYETKGAITEGKFTIPCYPGYTGMGDIYDWLWGRTEADTNYQGNWATLVKAVRRGASWWVEKYVDVKVASGSVKLDYGGKFVAIECATLGIQAPETADAYPTVDDVLLSLNPYRFAEAVISLDLGAGYVAELFSRNHDLQFDNMLSQADGENLNGSTFPTDLPNTEWTKWGVSFDRQLVDLNLRTAFLAGTECAYKLALSSGGSDCLFEMARGIYEKAPLLLPMSGMIKQGVNFKALTPIAGEGDDPEGMLPCEISESGGGS